jgi:diguanylate cyclase (GGDEF)-like protein
MQDSDDRTSAARDRDLAPAAADLRGILGSIGETVYDWDMTEDRLTWGAQAVTVLRAASPTAIASGRAYARLVVPGEGRSRYDTVTTATERDAGQGVAFQTVYAVKTASGEIQHVEDTGRWFAGLDGRPVRVHGVVRVLPASATGRPAAPVAGSDPLTGALTRAQLLDLLADQIGRSRKSHGTFAMLLFGIESLGEINEAYGFDVADKLIVGVAQRLRSVMRRADAMARVAGNKLAIVLTGCTEDQLPVAAARFLGSLRDAGIPTSAGTMAASVRAGGVLLPRFGHTVQDALLHADEALAAARASVSEAYLPYSPDRRRDTRRMGNRRFTDEVVAALNEHRVALARQPIVEARTRTVAMREALMRIRRTDGSVMSAASVIPTVEKLGFMPLLDQRVLDLALADLQADPSARLSINVSPASLRSPDWLAALAARLGARPDLAVRLVVEMTETCLVDDVEAMRQRLAAMKDLGVKLAVDDFGSGHTSFRHLRDLPFDIVKIDGAFVQNIGRSTDDRFFVRTLLDLARHLEVEVVAEWVTDEASAQMLAEWGVTYLQGELFDDAAAGTMATRAVA